MMSLIGVESHDLLWVVMIKGACKFIYSYTRRYLTF